MKIITTLYLVRHGQVENNLKGLFNGGDSDRSLNETGRRQAACLTAPFAKVAPDVIYSSPQKRALETAGCLRGDCKIPIITEEALREIRVGVVEGMSRRKLAQEDPRMWNGWNGMSYGNFAFPGGETLGQAADRTAAAIARIVRENRGKTVVVAGHMGVFLLMQCRLYDAAIAGFRHFPHMGNATYSRFEIGEDGHFHAVELAQDGHLLPELRPKQSRPMPEWMQRDHYFADFAD